MNTSCMFIVYLHIAGYRKSVFLEKNRYNFTLSTLTDPS